MISDRQGRKVLELMQTEKSKASAAAQIAIDSGLLLEGFPIACLPRRRAYPNRLRPFQAKVVCLEPLLRRARRKTVRQREQ